MSLLAVSTIRWGCVDVGSPANSRLAGRVPWLHKPIGKHSAARLLLSSD